jgi:transposase
VNVLSGNKVQEIEILLATGRYSCRKIASLLHINRETVNRYAALRKCGQNQPGVSTGSPPRPQPPASSDVAVEIQNQPEVSTGFCATVSTSACSAHAEWIAEQLKAKRNAVAIYQDLVDVHGFTHRYSSVKRFVAKLRHKEPDVYDILEFAPGEESQVDYGEGAPTKDPVTGKYRKPRLFVMTLRYSRRSFRKVVWKSSAETWARLHEEAFRYFGGATKFTVLDNLREGVCKPDYYDPEINRLYSELLKHYGVVADPCRVRDPDRKGTVENAVKHTQNTALQGRKFDSIEKQNEFLMQWEERWAAPRIHGSTKRQVSAMFEEEKPFLTTLPAQPFQFFAEERRTVDDARTITVDNVRYSANPALVGSKVTVRIYQSAVEIYDPKTHSFLRRHGRRLVPGSVVMEDADRIFNPSRQSKYALEKAKKIGPKI